MPGVYHTISSTASTLIELIKRPVRAFGRFCGRIVEVVSSIKKKVFGDDSPVTIPSTTLNQRTASIDSPEAASIASIDLGYPDNISGGFRNGVVNSPEPYEETPILPPEPPVSLSRVDPPAVEPRWHLGGKGQFLTLMSEAGLPVPPFQVIQQTMLQDIDSVMIGVFLKREDYCLIDKRKKAKLS